MSVNETIAWMVEQRRLNTRHSQAVVSKGTFLLEKGHAKKLGEETWAFLEQVAIAALDLGRWELAEVCISRLRTRFPSSPRVQSLEGMFLEARGKLIEAVDFYDKILEGDETNLMVMKRRIAALKALPKNEPSGGTEKAIEALNRYLDAVYTDEEAWLELAELYLELHMYGRSVFAMEELLLLSPANSFHALRYAETLYTAGEVRRAYKAFARVIEMCGVVEGGAREGPWVRALWGVKLCTTRLLNEGKTTTTRAGDDSSAEETAVEEVEAMDGLVSELLLSRAYGSGGGEEGTKRSREAARKVIGGR